jgi:hypothetical protein
MSIEKRREKRAKNPVGNGKILGNSSGEPATSVQGKP